MEKRAEGSATHSPCPEAGHRQAFFLFRSPELLCRRHLCLWPEGRPPEVGFDTPTGDAGLRTLHPDLTSLRWDPPVQRTEVTTFGGGYSSGSSRAGQARRGCALQVVKCMRWLGHRQVIHNPSNPADFTRPPFGGWGIRQNSNIRHPKKPLSLPLGNGERDLGLGHNQFQVSTPHPRQVHQ